MKVIPVLNCPDVDCIKQKLEVAKTFLHGGEMIHLDVTDGSFATHQTWADPLMWPKLGSPFPLEVHLMVHHPELYMDNWFTAGARRIIVHVESLTPHSLHEVMGAARRHGAEVMLSSKPESEPEELEPYLRHFHAFQVLAVQPGPVGQKFLPFITEKVRFLREEAPNAIIEVDGGMNPETARRVKEMGADTIVSASYLWSAADPKKAFEELSKI